MNHYLLFDDEHRQHLLPFTHLRPCADLLCGSMTFRERWESLLHKRTSSLTPDYLSEVYPSRCGEDNYYINGLLVANESLVKAIQQLPAETSLVKDGKLLAWRTAQSCHDWTQFLSKAREANQIGHAEPVIIIQRVWELFTLNQQLQQDDFAIITKAKHPQSSTYATVLQPENVFIEEGAKVGAGVILNASEGPIFIAAGSEIMEGALIRGPFTLREQSTVKMAAKIYGATSIGPGCKVGGEIGNTVFIANANKGHDGYLGNSVIGEWCNLGADTNSSNLKNNYDEVKIWDEHNNRSVKTGLQFCGLLMGDHSKCGINTMFNTGTVVGISANIFGSGFPEKFIPSFSWGGAEGQTTYQFAKAKETITRVLARRNKKLTDAQIKVLEHIFHQTMKQREIFSNTL